MGTKDIHDNRMSKGFLPMLFKSHYSHSIFHFSFSVTPMCDVQLNALIWYNDRPKGTSSFDVIRLILLTFLLLAYHNVSN